MTGRPCSRFVARGQVFRDLVVIDPDCCLPARQDGYRCRAALCRCVCGTEKLMSIYVLLSGSVRSCGCLGATTHGLGRHPLYFTWFSMLRRCGDPEHHAYRNYGARGIRVCERWHEVANFISDIESSLGPRPEGMSLDRICNDGNYEPGNVRWATWSEQQLNRRRTA